MYFVIILDSSITSKRNILKNEGTRNSYWKQVKSECNVWKNKEKSRKRKSTWSQNFVFYSVEVENWKASNFIFELSADDYNFVGMRIYFTK